MQQWMDGSLGRKTAIAETEARILLPGFSAEFITAWAYAGNQPDGVAKHSWICHSPMTDPESGTGKFRLGATTF
jgi:hypothetical protein